MQDPKSAELAERLGVEFENLKDLEAALKHRSWVAEHPGNYPNERLEFLGDTVLGLVVTTYLFRTFPTFPEGELAKVRASVVSTESLAIVGSEMGLGQHMLLGKGEDQSGGREKRSILADAVEAVLGSVYLACGYDAAEKLIMRYLIDRIAIGAEGPGGGDYKTRLQEYAARNLDHVPVYVLQDQGPDHQKRFTATVMVGEEQLGQGEGRSKKAAEQAAAQVAWETIEAAPAK